MYVMYADEIYTLERDIFSGSQNLLGTEASKDVKTV